MASHRALLFDGPGLPLSVRQRPTPPVGPNQVLIRIQACGGVFHFQASHRTGTEQPDDVWSYEL